jgi:hypothetical protein
MPVLDLSGNNWEEMAKRPKPTNERLHNLFAGVDHILIKPGRSSLLYAKPNPTLFEIKQPDVIKQLATLFEINEAQTGFYCMCRGTYDVELYANNQLQATIGYHHEYSIRYEGWSSDAGLATPEALVNFLAQQGFTLPLEDYLATKRRVQEDQQADSEWLALAPTCFTTFWEHFRVGGDFSQALIDALNEEIPDKADQIIALLQTFGHTKSPWTGYPAYEDVPAEILNNYLAKYILEVYGRSDKNDKLRSGLGRYICSYEFRRVRKKHLNYITEEVIDDLEKYYTGINDEKGIYEVNRLRKEKNLNSGNKD